jgi:hypothetical protein
MIDQMLSTAAESFIAVQMKSNLASGTEMVDRRSATRFPMDLEVRYKIAGKHTVELGSGRTINMASSGILFTTERTLAPGERLEVAVNWPAQLDNKCPLKLVIGGRVVRSEAMYAAITIDRYEFRTQGSRGMA